MRNIRSLALVLLAASTCLSAQTYSVVRNFGKAAGDPTGLLYPGSIAQSRGGAMLTTAPDSDNYSLDQGKAFRIWPGGELQVLHQFGGPDGSWPFSGLTLASDGKFYGTTRTGGTLQLGTIFKMSQSGSVTTLHEFQGGLEGEDPYAAPIQSAQGDFYGTAQGSTVAGSTDHGSIYKITGNGSFTRLHAFTGSDGAYPIGPLVQGTDNYFYGTTTLGGQNPGPYGDGFGTIFRVSRSGDFKVLVNFDGIDGAAPYAGLIQANDGNFYGTTTNGGSSDLGVLFRMRPNGILTVLHSFGGSDGAYPFGQMVQASDGNLYGATAWGGKYGRGVLFRSTLAGNVVTLHDFDDATGSLPFPALIQHTNGKLYGATGFGGRYGRGVFYSLDADLPPFVTYLPTYGRAGALVQILGQGFTSGSQVSFNGKLAASPVVVYPTYLRVVVPSGATTGPITVTTNDGTLTSNKVFIVHPN